ncbi:metal ABC transporter permease [Streptacidiphilus monticola]
MTSTGFSWNLLADVQQMWSYPFMVNAFRAGAVVAVVAGAVGWFMVLRRQTFAGHTLSVVAFPGASFAVLTGISLSLGYFGFCVAAALVLAGLRRGRAADDGAESAATGCSRRSCWPAAICSWPCTRDCWRARRRCCSAASSASPPGRS